MKVPLRIRLPFATEAEFIERYGVNVERGGIFIATRAPKPEGTEISFELVLKEGERLMRGEGIVQAVRETESPGKGGMLVRFVRLEPRTKALIDRIAAARDGITEPEPVATEPSAPLPSAPVRAPAPTPAPPPPSKPVRLADDVVMGIDLGTTTCRAALFLEGSARLVPVGQGQYVLPSVVAVDAKGLPVVGHKARGVLVATPQNGAAGFKRIMGRRARSKQIRELAPRCAFTISADPEGDAGVELSGRTWSAPELAGLLLKELKACASEMLGRELPARPPGQAASMTQAPFWKTPTGPTGEAHVLVTYANVPSRVTEPTWLGKQPVVLPFASWKVVSITGGRSRVVATPVPTFTA
jgi:molecular chaperone DnaK